jgi:hypothetical protein
MICYFMLMLMWYGSEALAKPGDTANTVYNLLLRCGWSFYIFRGITSTSNGMILPC